jgi:hypothetical protein
VYLKEDDIRCVGPCLAFFGMHAFLSPILYATYVAIAEDDGF